MDTSKVVESKLVDGERTIEGLTGRTLVIPKDWKNPTDKWHVGVKNAYDLYPRGHKDQVVHDRHEKLWDPSTRIVRLTLSRSSRLNMRAIMTKRTICCSMQGISGDFYHCIAL